MCCNAAAAGLAFSMRVTCWIDTERVSKRSRCVRCKRTLLECLEDLEVGRECPGPPLRGEPSTGLHHHVRLDADRELLGLSVSNHRD